MTYRRLLVALTPLLLLLVMMLGLRFFLLVNSSTTDSAENDREPDLPTIPHVRPAPIPYRTPDASTLRRLTATVQGQLSALRAGNYPDALGFADSWFRRTRSPEQFQAMIEQSYPEMIRFREIRVVEARVAGPVARLEVDLVSPEARRVRVSYGLSQVKDLWFITSCYRAEVP